MLRASLAAIAILLALGPVVSAQTDSVVAVGISASLPIATAPQADHHMGVGLIGRLRRGTGLGFSLGLGWFTSDFRTEVDGEQLPIATLRIKPLMFGASYAWQFNRYALIAGIVGGWSFNSLGPGAASQAYARSIGMPDASLDVENGWAVRPGVTLWYELGNHFAASASVGYMVNRPTLVARNGIAEHRETVNLSATVVSFGFVYGVF